MTNQVNFLRGKVLELQGTILDMEMANADNTAVIAERDELKKALVAANRTITKLEKVTGNAVEAKEPFEPSEVPNEAPKRTSNRPARKAEDNGMAGEDFKVGSMSDDEDEVEVDENDPATKSLKELRVLAKSAGVKRIQQKSKVQLIEEISAGGEAVDEALDEEDEAPAPKVAPKSTTTKSARPERKARPDRKARA